MHQQNIQQRDNRQWYAVYCKPLKERQVAAALQETLALTVYLPEVIRRFRKRVQYTSFFPRYLFVHVDLRQVLFRSLISTPGVVGLVGFGEGPQAIPQTVISALHRSVEQLNTQGGLSEHHFQVDDPVRLKTGPLRGLEAIFLGPMKPSARVHVLVEFLGQLREAEVDVDSLEAVGGDNAAKRQRRTRGKGRSIRNSAVGMQDS